MRGWPPGFVAVEVVHLAGEAAVEPLLEVREAIGVGRGAMPESAKPRA